jgi:uncharacterized protein YgbK (DUF1537 family)
VRRLAAVADDIPLSEDAAARAADALAAGRCALVHTTALGADDAERIPGTLASVVAQVAGEGNVHALVLSGGEAAIHVARALGARGMLLEDELEPGVPVSRLIGPRSYPVVTKAGGFGGPRTLIDAVAALGGRV